VNNPWVVFLVLFVIAVVLRRFVNGAPWAVMIRDRLASLGGGWAATIMALVLGIAMTVHGMQKYVGGADGVAKFFGSLGIPAPGLMAWVIIVVELVGGVCILAGLLPQLWAALFAIDMVVAIITAHWSQGYSGGDTGPGYEKNLALLALALAIAFIGSGHRLSLVDLVMPDKD
jgi:putative oxidoreductase